MGKGTIKVAAGAGAQARRLPLVVGWASLQDDLSEESGCIPGIRFVFSVSYGEGHGVVGFQFKLAGIARGRTCSFDLVEGWVSAIAIDVGVE